MLHKEFGLISIIMAAYNAEKTIEQAINSVLRQTYTDFELLVVNDCSKDRTVELVKSIAAKDNRVRLISNEKNSGVSFTRKHGLEESNGSWIAILDSDDAWTPDKLEKQIELQKRTNGVRVWALCIYGKAASCRTGCKCGADRCHLGGTAPSATCKR